MLRSLFFSTFLIGICFAIPVFAVAKVIIGNTTNVWQSTLPISVTIGTFLTTIILWPFLAGRSDSLLASVGVGALIGVVAHLVSAIVSCFTPIILDTYGLIPPPPRDTEWVQPSFADNLSAIGFVLLWWCLLAVFWLAWLTAAVGAFIGVILGTVHHFLRPPAIEQPGAKQDGEQLPPSARWNLNPWSSPLANVVSLLIISVLCGVAVLTANFIPEPIHEDVTEERAAEGH